MCDSVRFLKAQERDYDDALAEAAPDEEIFQKVLDKFFGGKKDDKPLRIIGR
ncbi:MAG: hypothetical protein VZR23_05710 [Lachnospiraceae bacterium]|nr:hypothetical protein [Lachnospiraceae bacterium]